ncbi:MAG: thioredoxin domain-containing protein [bacterium]|nr:thioredoxin domain-containing protein [bacterium]
MDNQQKQSLAVPIAIVLAGALVGVGVYMSGKPVGTATGNVPTAVNQARDIVVPPVTSADNTIGTTNADIVLVEYSDTSCPFCKNFHSTMKTLQSEYGASGKMAWVYRHFPIVQLHPTAPKESEATQCAADQGKFWPYIDYVFGSTSGNLSTTQLSSIAASVGLDTTTFDACLSSGKHTAAISASVAEAQKLGANGTPTSYLLLKKALPDNVVEDIMYVFAQYRQPDGSLLGGVSKDKKVVHVSGALPYDFMKGLINIILGA